MGAGFKLGNFVESGLVWHSKDHKHFTINRQLFSAHSLKFAEGEYTVLDGAGSNRESRLIVQLVLLFIWGTERHRHCA